MKPLSITALALGWLLLVGTGSVATAAGSEPVALHLGQQLEAGKAGSTASAWNQVYQRWLAWLQAGPLERPQAAQQLSTALQDLDQVWQAAEEQAPPFFYAIDTATRMQA